MKNVLRILVILGLCSSMALAAIKFSGTARIRPRYDMKIYQDSSGEVITKGDMYYQYRAKLNILGTVGDGFYFKG